MSPKCKCPKTQMSLKLKCPHNANNTRTQMSPKGQCHQNANVTKVQISPLELTFVFLYLPNGSGKTRSPDLVHINPNGLPGLSESRRVCVIACIFTQEGSYVLFWWHCVVWWKDILPIVGYLILDIFLTFYDFCYFSPFLYDTTHVLLLS